MITEIRKQSALLRAGEIIGISSQLDIEALEEITANPQPDFHYTEQCKAVIEFAKTLRGGTVEIS